VFEKIFTRGDKEEEPKFEIEACTNVPDLPITFVLKTTRCPGVHYDLPNRYFDRGVCMDMSDTGARTR